ncbi:MaoC family dehydratase [Streptomyces mayonensis]|uniref:MaoC family dehydratase n=1 Tax=Streptomyces mayonensis TaxID=2750816 RepID=UPI001C1E2D01|nr:MaoC family dehydratase [Streptomyces sp. A108]MBU6534996.1 MaoC family dehydratase [Streptomyces sp. A108]
MTTTAQGIEGLVSLAGRDLGRTDWLEITQERVNTFADATNDHQWIHTDPEKAKEGPFGGPVAHGYLTLSLIIPLFGGLLELSGISMSVNYGLEKVRFPSPVPVGAKIRLHGVVDSVEEVKGNGVQMGLSFTVEVEGSAKPACVAQAVYRHYA